jgi:hypothetical protein
MMWEHSRASCMAVAFLFVDLGSELLAQCSWLEHPILVLRLRVQ